MSCAINQRQSCNLIYFMVFKFEIEILWAVFINNFDFAREMLLKIIDY